jgi:bifunctional non-homologous end joining protein LigD
MIETKHPEKLLLEELKDGDLKIILHGTKLQGAFGLVNMHKDEKNWLLIKKHDAFVNTDNVLKEEIPASVLRKILLSGTKTKMLQGVTPMLANLSEHPFNDPDWLYELKWDGYRAMTQIDKGTIRLYSRNNKDYNKMFPSIVHALERVSNDVILDGEIVAFGKDGKPNFQHIQDYRRKSKDITLIYYVFDLLYIDGYDIREMPLVERKMILQKILPTNAHLKYNDHIEKYGLQLFTLAKEKNNEGIMAKKKDSPYLSARSNDWLKIKHISMQEAIICGFTQPNGNRDHFGALILGLYDGNELRYVGHAGGGFDDKKLKEIIGKLKPIITTNCPFAVVPETNTPATWVKPKFVAQIKFSEWTRDGLMRQPVFLGLRKDKKPTEVTQEVLQHKTKASRKTKTVDFTNLTKIFWPHEGYTKGDLIKYYEAMAPIILPYLKDRPQSLLRHPDGITGKNFYQKEMSIAPDWAKLIPIHSDSENKTIHWLLCNDKETLLYMANMGCIEINPWSSRYTKKEYPDFLSIDLDPNGVAFEEVIRTANVAKQIMDNANIEAFIKTSGKSGLHIEIPLGAKYTFDQTRQFAEILARTINKALPETTSVVRNPDKRGKKIYVDYLQNRSGQTLAAPYSVRPVPGAQVSTPLEWSEVNPKLHPSNFTIKNIFKRIDKKGDLWKPFRLHKGINMLKSLEFLILDHT